jgi:hypothetical protein
MERIPSVLENRSAAATILIRTFNALSLALKSVGNLARDLLASGAIGPTPPEKL